MARCFLVQQRFFVIDVSAARFLAFKGGDLLGTGIGVFIVIDICRLRTYYTPLKAYVNNETEQEKNHTGL